ncbi:Uncharacterised protein [Mycobacteroides abscessus subsp. abscessus]|nr:Uncharacterised protein [Mycobacteroides abscessus subsp. abscessus]
MTSEIISSPRPVSTVRPLMKAPGFTPCRNTENTYPPTMPMAHTSPLSSSATKVDASTRGTTSRWIGSMPSTCIASISSRMVRAPRSAQIAVAPAPATTSTVTTGPS